MKNKNFITYFFIGVLFLFLVMYPVMFVLIQKGIITPEFSNIYTVISEEGNILTKLNNKTTNIKNNINNKLSNYLFLYSEVNGSYRPLKNSFNLYNNEFKSLGTNSDGEYIFQNKDGFYILQTNQNDDYINSKMNENILFYNNLGKIVDLYIYLPSRYEFQDFNDAVTIRNMADLKQEFLAKLDNVTVGELKVKERDEYQKLFYHTDHHWNAYGALQGYNDICQMLNLDCEVYQAVTSDILYRGSIGKMVADAKTTDYFTFIDEDITLKATVEGAASPTNFKPRKIKTDKGLFYDQYVGYYNGLYSEVTYEGTGEDNLFILGDSYAWQIDYLLAQNFAKTYVLNPKYIEKMNLKNYLQENNITKVLVLMETQTTIFDNYDYGYVASLGGI